MLMYQLRNEFLFLEISSFGAELKSVVDVKTGYEFIWQGDKTIWGRSAPVLFPIIGREDREGILIENKVYPIPQHGFARDYDFKCVKYTKDEVCFELAYEDINEGLYPYKFRLYVSYSINNFSLQQSFKICNEQDESLYFSVGGHPAFNLPESDISKYFFQFNRKDAINRFDVQNNLLMGTESQVSKSGRIELNSNTFDNEVIIIKKDMSNEVCLQSLDNNFSVNIDFSEFSFIGLWAPKKSEQFICIEPWQGITGTLNGKLPLNQKAGILKLDSGEQKQFSFTMTLHYVKN